MPFYIADDLDLIVIATISKAGFGQFVFRYLFYLEKGIVTGKIKLVKENTGFIYPGMLRPTCKQKKHSNGNCRIFLKLQV